MSLTKCVSVEIDKVNKRVPLFDIKGMHYRQNECFPGDKDQSVVLFIDGSAVDCMMRTDDAIGLAWLFNL